jgi:hypothetical protein
MPNYYENFILESKYFIFGGAKCLIIMKILKIQGLKLFRGDHFRFGSVFI